MKKIIALILILIPLCAYGTNFTPMENFNAFRVEPRELAEHIKAPHINLAQRTWWYANIIIVDWGNKIIAYNIATYTKITIDTFSLLNQSYIDSRGRINNDFSDLWTLVKTTAVSGDQEKVEALIDLLMQPEFWESNVGNFIEQKKSLPASIININCTPGQLFIYKLLDACNSQKLDIFDKISEYLFFLVSQPNMEDFPIHIWYRYGQKNNRQDDFINISEELLSIEWTNDSIKEQYSWTLQNMINGLKVLSGEPVDGNSYEIPENISLNINEYGLF